MRDVGTPGSGRPAAEQSGAAPEIVHEAVALLMKQRRLTRSDALHRLHEIAGEVGIKQHEAAALVLSLERG